MAFEAKYWRENYAEPETMDGIFNANRHAAYLKACFELEYVHVTSIIDFGFGLGHLFDKMLETFLPARAYGLEPSGHAYRIATKRGLTTVPGMKLELVQEDLETWALREGKRKRARPFDLGLCTSVLQYLETPVLEAVVPVIARRVRWLYLTVPTDRELDRQIEEEGFRDEYAIRRSQAEYQRVLSPHFTFVSARLVESRAFHDEGTTPFSDLLFRF